jgi:hypothetical protein
LARKGQLNSIDFITAIVIFMVLVVFLVTFWFVSVSHLTYGIEENRIGIAAISVSDMLVKSQGAPKKWENDPSNAEAIGLAESANVLSESKIETFIMMDYDESRELMGIDYEYYFFVEELNGNMLYEKGNVTVENQAISVTRFAILDDEKVRMRLVIHG